MGIHFNQALDVHADALKLRSERTKVLASNIANESTPGYQSRDFDFRQQLASLQDAGSDSPDLGEGGIDLSYRVPDHPAANGNTVELGVEQAEFSQNISDFQTSLAFANMTFKGLNKAINGQ